MTRIEDIPTAPIGQDGSGQDKSIAAPSPYTHFPASSTLANDGLLAGRELESDAELDGLIQSILESIDAESPAASPAASPGFPYRPNGPVYHVNPAIRGPIDFDLVEKLQAMAPAFGMSPAWGATYANGQIGNTVPKSDGYIRYGKPLTEVTNETLPFSPKPIEPEHFRCLKPKWCKGIDPDDYGYTIWHPCHKCENCIANDLNDKSWRWDVGRGPFQTSILVHGAANADEARKWTLHFARAVNISNRASMVTPDGEIWVVGADPMDADAIQRIRDFAAAEHGNAQRPSKAWPNGRPAMQCTVKSENVAGSDLLAFASGNRTAQGEQRHVAFRLFGPAFAKVPIDDDFSLGDATPIPDDEPTPTAVYLSKPTRESRAWRYEHNPAARESMRLDARADQARKWCDGKNLITHKGPVRMVEQYKAYLAGRREYEPAWDIVAQLYGGG